MVMTDIIDIKKQSGELTEKQLVYVAAGAADGSIPDYQLSALLMAIRLNGMTSQECAALTLAMARSGEMADLSALPGIPVDKHSTGGVGDTTTLIVVPLVAACGAFVAKMSGRGLSHTGGTIDKLEAISGFGVELSMERFIDQVRRVGCAVVGQSARMAPADKALYALRDVTSTVDSIPLIAASVMSKKIASGAKGIMLDVKTGSGAIIEDLEGSIALAESMVAIGTLSGREVRALVTGMEQPLGSHIGNALEVKEAIDVLSGKVEGELLAVSLALGAGMLQMANPSLTPSQAECLLKEALRSGAGLQKLAELVAAQGGDARVCFDTARLPGAAVVQEVYPEKDGFVTRMDAQKLGFAALHMGAGRQKKDDKIDPAVGFVLHKRVGDRVQRNEPLFTLHAANSSSAASAEEAIRKAIEIGMEKPSAAPLIYAEIDKSGTRRFA